MTGWDFLMSTEGSRLIDAVIVLVLGIGAYLQWLTHRTTADTNSKVSQVQTDLAAHINGKESGTAG